MAFNITQVMVRQLVFHWRIIYVMLKNAANNLKVKNNYSIMLNNIIN